MMRLLLVAAFVLWALPTQAETTYVTHAGGNNSNACGAVEGSPKATIANALACLDTPGDVLILKCGSGTSCTFAESIISPGANAITPGNSGAYMRVAGYAGHTVTLQPASGLHVVAFNRNEAYIEIDNLTLDGVNVSDQALKIECVTPGTRAAHHIRIQNSVLKNSGASQVLNSISASGCVGGNEFLDNTIIGGGASDLDHGIYIQTSDNVVDGNDISNILGACVHLYHGSISHSNNIVRNNRCHDSQGGTGLHRTQGVIVANNSVNAKVYNNVVWNLTGTRDEASCIFAYRGTGTEVYNNTCYGNIRGIITWTGSAAATIRNNIAVSSTDDDFENNSGNGTWSNNLCDVTISGLCTGGDPDFTNAASDDFTIDSGSDAYEAGFDTSATVTTDIIGTSRPQGAAVDIGAYEVDEAGSGGSGTVGTRRVTTFRGVFQ